MPPEVKHHTVGTLPLAVALAAAAGFVDAFIYQRVAPVFVANMSGNLVRLGMSAGDHDGRGTVAVLIALAGFITGVIGGAAHLDMHVRAERPTDPSTLLLSEAALIIALPVMIHVFDIGFTRSIRPLDDIVIAIGSVAMGLQAVALRRVGQTAVSTTYGTGAVVRLGEKLALAAKRTPRPEDHRRRRSIVVLGAVLGSYVLGAFVAASLSADPTWLFIPAAVPLAGWARLRRQRRTPAHFVAASEHGLAGHAKRLTIRRRKR
jgi:uncharacterized membrane protein YoaK (UPF0700 family)